MKTRKITAKETRLLACSRVGPTEGRTDAAEIKKEDSKKWEKGKNGLSFERQSGATSSCARCMDAARSKRKSEGCLQIAGISAWCLLRVDNRAARLVTCRKISKTLQDRRFGCSVWISFSETSHIIEWRQ